MGLPLGRLRRYQERRRAGPAVSAGKRRSEEELVFSSVDISKRYRTEYDQFGNYIRDYADGYDLYQRLTVTSADIDKVEQISRDIPAHRVRRPVRVQRAGVLLHHPGRGEAGSDSEGHGKRKAEDRYHGGGDRLPAGKAAVRNLAYSRSRPGIPARENTPMTAHLIPAPERKQP